MPKVVKVGRPRKKSVPKKKTVKKKVALLAKKKVVKKTTSKKPYQRKWGNQFNKKYTDDFLERLADEMYEWFLNGLDYSTNTWLKDFAIKKGFAASRMTYFCSKNEYFAYIHSLCNDIQESILFKIGLRGQAAMPIFALKNVAKWKDKEEDSERDLPDEYRKALEGLAISVMVKNL